MILKEKYEKQIYRGQMSKQKFSIFQQVIKMFSYEKRK